MFSASLSVAGLGLNFKQDRPGVISVLRRRYAPFVAEEAGGYSFSVSSRSGVQNPFKPVVSFDGKSLNLGRGDFKAALDLASGAGTLMAAPNEQCLDAFLRSLISALLIRAGGFMLHSAGIVKNGKAYLFLGRSGAGKSTLSKLAAGAGCEVISDEINLLRQERGRCVVYGSPFWGEMRADGRPGRWPLGGIYLLKKSRVNAVTPCGSAEALGLLLRCLLNFEKGPGVSGQVLDNAAALLKKNKFARLEFTKKDASFMELI